MVERGERGERMLLSRSADYRYELMMDDTNLKLLERIAGFKRLREDARRELQKWHGGRVAFEPLQKLMAQLNEVYRRLHQGQEVETIAAAIDKTTASTEPHP